MRVARERTSPADFEAGFSLLVYSGDSSPAAGYGEVLDRMVALNVNSLAIVFPIYTDDVRSTTVRRGPDTPPDEHLAALVRGARARGFSVMLRPVLDEASILPSWRGAIRPRDAAAWFASYGALIVSYAQLAQREGADSLAIGTELTSMETYVTSWRSLIDQVKQAYAGRTTYAFNFGSTFQTGFWPQLDFVSVDAYFPLDRAPVSATPAEMAADWRRWLTMIERIDAPFRKQVVFTEVGVVPKTGAHRRPWDANVQSGLDLDEQSAYYQATCDAAPGVVSGLYWWASGPSLPGDLAPTDYSPLGRPAENVVRSCYERIEAR
jgi:Glycoside Hydrolase Family 113